MAYINTKEENDGRVRAQGRVDMKDDGRNYVFTVNVWTRVKGVGRTGRGHSLFIMYGPGDEVVSVLAARKYCSTGTSREKEKHDSQERQYRKGYYDANVVSEMLLVVAEDKGGVPGTTAELVKWTKEVVGPELRNIRDNLTKGGVAEGGNYFIRKLK